MNKIYLISSDGYRDNLNIKFFATNIEELKNLLKEEMSIYDRELLIESVVVDFEEGVIQFKYIDSLGDTESDEYVVFTLNRIKNENKSFELPNYWNMSEKLETDEPLNPLELFINEQTPADNEQNEHFRKTLIDLIDYVR